MQEDIQKHIARVVEELFGQQVDVVLEIPEEKFGDYSTNVALRLAKPLDKNPREIAEGLVEKLDHEAIAEMTIAGPGFINIRLTDTSLKEAISLKPCKHTEKRVVIETNNPNPFKAMHIGHAYNAILADTIANIIEAGGAETFRVSYHGDVGAHVGKSMYSILSYIGGDIEKLHAIPKAERNNFMSRMYAEGAKAYKEDDAAREKINELAKQSFNPPEGIYRETYELCKAWSFEEIDQIVGRIGNQAIAENGRYLESQTDILGAKTVRENIGDVFVESQGAVVFPGEQYGSFDSAFISSAGNSLYGARDLGLMQLKQRDFHPDKSYIVTAEEQKAYFQGVIKAAELCLPDLGGVTENISTGTVKLTSGKMSSRDGDVIEIQWLFNQIADAIKTEESLATDEIVQAALRYEFLKVRSGSDVVFDINESVSIHGNSGIYLQYAHVRACSILRKSIQSRDVPLYPAEYTPSERTLARKLSHYSGVLDAAVASLQPHLICTYLYELCKEFNRFYEDNQVIGSEREVNRIELVRKYQAVLENGLTLLGIPAIEKM